MLALISILTPCVFAGSRLNHFDPFDSAFAGYFGWNPDPLSLSPVEPFHLECTCEDPFNATPLYLDHQRGHHHISAFLPRVQPGNLHLQLISNQLLITADRMPVLDGCQSMCPRGYNRFERRVLLPEHVKPSDIVYRFDSETLHIQIRQPNMANFQNHPSPLKVPQTSSYRSQAPAPPSSPVAPSSSPPPPPQKRQVPQTSSYRSHPPKAPPFPIVPPSSPPPYPPSSSLQHRLNSAKRQLTSLPTPMLLKQISESFESDSGLEVVEDVDFEEPINKKRATRGYLDMRGEFQRY
mmetsp:Transcript_27282/g.38585  ORF Transcript_27282/g.38585 Transcript_27282/m.38585 type:complete len:294 (+) Transcript_27282:44-925(+)